MFVDIGEELLEDVLICLDWDTLRSKCRKQVLSCELARAGCRRQQRRLPPSWRAATSGHGWSLDKGRESSLLGLSWILSCRSHSQARSKSYSSFVQLIHTKYPEEKPFYLIIRICRCVVWISGKPFQRPSPATRRNVQYRGESCHNTEESTRITKVHHDSNA